MACRRFIASYCVSGNVKAARSLPVLSAKHYSTDREETTKPTHTGQVCSWLKVGLVSLFWGDYLAELIFMRKYGVFFHSFFRHSKQMTTEIFDLQMQHVTSTKIGVQWFTKLITRQSLWDKTILFCLLMRCYFHRYKFDRRNPTKGMHRTRCVLWWWRSTFRSSKSLYQFGKRSSTWKLPFKVQLYWIQTCFNWSTCSL